MAKGKKKSGNHLGVVIGITVFLIIAFVGIAAVAWFYLFREDAQAATQAVYDEYTQDVVNGNYEGIYDLIHEDVQANVDKDTVTARYTNIFTGIGASNIAFTLLESGENEDGSGWYYRYRMTMDTSAGSLDNTYSMQICRDSENQFKIMWSSNLIFPQLDDTDTVRVNTLDAKRGTIYDVNGNVLAQDGEGASVGLVPGKISQTTRDADLEQLASLLEVSVDYINEQLSASWVTDDVFVPIRSVAVDNEELISQVLEISGVMVNTTSAREYPYGETLAHLTGYVQAISAEELETMADQGYTSSSIVGKSGLEQIYESSLRGTDGCEILILYSDGTVKETLGYQAAVDGNDVHLTIDAQLCQILYDQLEGDNGLAVAMNMKTGAILSLVSTPSYNPNEFVAGITNSSWEALSTDEDLPMYNRYTSTWVPGSSFKPITAAIGLDNGTIDPNEVSASNGLSWQKDSSWGNLFVTTLVTYGDVTLQKALAYSDNIYFAQQTLNMGRSAFVEGLKTVGFGETMPFEMSLGSSTYGTLEESADEVMLANSGYGQGEMLVNPIHLASMYSAFMNDGNMLQPYLVSNSEELGGEAAQPGSYWKTGVFSAESAQIVNEDLRTVISEGTGSDAQSAGVTLAGKTGTAEIKDSQDDTDGTELGWFVAYEIDNTEDPILILMMVEDVLDRDGSHYVVPKVTEAFSQYRGTASE